jgi:hypothetical protein
MHSYPPLTVVGTNGPCGTGSHSVLWIGPRSVLAATRARASAVIALFRSVSSAGRASPAVAPRPRWRR